ncbi:MAG: hypothetical protein LBB94_05415 [Clostridiales bacterium]|jgi:hypothetical protein|nr:hypothetical protein [Clostridiales bacterium]
MRVKVTIDRQGLKKLSDTAARVLEMSADACLTEIVSGGTIPFDYGTMQNVQTFADTSEAREGKFSIVTQAPQAERLYFHPEYNFQTVNNANAGAGWFDDFIKSGRVKDIIAAMYNKLRGKNW